MKLFLPLLLLTCLYGKSQSADFLVLKKSGRTIQSFYTGSKIALQTSSGAFIDANITAVKNDSIFLQQFIIQKMPYGFGGYYIDTLESYRYTFHYKQIIALGNKAQRGFSITGSGASLFTGGILLTLGSGVVAIADSKKFSPALLGAAVALGGTGYLLMRSGGKPIKLGKKYQLVYMNVTEIKKGE